jgi:hypothetical protein
MVIAVRTSELQRVFGSHASDYAQFGSSKARVTWDVGGVALCCLKTRPILSSITPRKSVFSECIRTSSLKFNDIHQHFADPTRIQNGSTVRD